MNDDATLLRRYVREGDETAFAELVGRHIHLVWGAARRVTGDADLARDVAQTVFCDLARKARSLPENTVLVGWLHRAACHAAGKTVRGNARRAERERLAMNLQDPAGSDADARIAETLQPVVDEALAALSVEDRDAVLLRFFGKKSLAEVGVALGVSDDAAQKRVSRALEQLRDRFRSRGLSVSAGAVAAAMNAAGAEVAPAFLSAGITATAVGSVSSVSWFASLALMKTPAIIATVAALGIAAAYQTHALGKVRQENAGLLRRIAEIQVPAVVSPPAGVVSDSEKDAEILRLRAKVAELLRQPAVKAVAASSQNEAELAQQLAFAKAELDTIRAVEQYKARAAARVNAGKNLGLAARIYAVDNQEMLPTTFEQMKNEMSLNANGEYPGGIRPDQFEFFPQPRVISEQEPQMILFRERETEMGPNGMLSRTYVLVDGSVHQANSEARMAEIEREGTAR
jgi:RNA polymerase sigma factor (sigma-70 family)